MDTPRKTTAQEDWIIFGSIKGTKLRETTYQLLISRKEIAWAFVIVPLAPQTTQMAICLRAQNDQRTSF